MNFLSSLFGGYSRSRSYGRRGMSYGHGYGHGRARQVGAGGFLGSPMGRMALGSLAAYAARRFFGRRRIGY
jgi:hypothetical protein